MHIQISFTELPWVKKKIDDIIVIQCTQSKFYTTLLITINQTRMRSYGTYNRDVVENFETVLIIESVLIIET